MTIDEVREKVLAAARKVFEENRECYIALWALQNPDEDFSQWTLCFQPDWSNGEQRYWMEKRC